jgi:hypothetical protein
MSLELICYPLLTGPEANNNPGARSEGTSNHLHSMYFHKLPISSEEFYKGLLEKYVTMKVASKLRNNETNTNGTLTPTSEIFSRGYPHQHVK